MLKAIKVFLSLALFTLQPYLFSELDDYFKYKVEPSASNYGNTGVLEMPNARFLEEASLRFLFSGSFPNEFTSLTASPFNWFEATYRYTEVKNKNYGSSSYSGNQSLKDKGFDIKLRLNEESFYIPAIALGIRDLAGTGVFSSEYLVASKQFNKLDLSLGLGWGILGIEGGASNPLEKLSSRFKDRELDVGKGGEFSYNSWFSGQTSLFGALEYDLPKYGVRLKLEYDTSNPDDNYRNPFPVKNRFNIGFVHHLSSSLNFGASYERGNQIRVFFSLNGNFLKDTLNKPKPRNVVKLNNEQLERIKKNKSIFYRSMNRSLRDESIFIQAATLEEDEVDISVASSRFYSMTRTSGRSARIADALLPHSVKKINIHSMNGDLEIAKISYNRGTLSSANSFQSSPQELLLDSVIQSDSSQPLYKEAQFIPTIDFPEVSWNMSPSMRHQIGGPEGFYLGQVQWQTDINFKFRRNLSLYSSIGVNIYDTFTNLRNSSQSSIPHVRSDIQDYLENGKNNIKRMQLEYLYSPINDLFVRADLGIFEEMFGGYGGEILYRPFDRKFSIGFSLHKVFQRDFNQLFTFRDYQTTTGHLAFYSDLPRNINLKVLAGKYLAKDKGVTVDLSRRFKTGFTLGVFATKTNLSAEEFGEGSFDKGFYISVPTKLFYSDYRTGNISFGLKPLTKDGGSILTQYNALFGILGDSNSSSIRRDWNNTVD